MAAILGKFKLRGIDPVSKFFLVSIFAILAYFLVLFLESIIFGLTFSALMMNFSSMKQILLNLFAIVFSLFLGFLFSSNFFDKDLGKIFNLVTLSMSSDEKQLMNEIRQAKVITQDSLRFRLDWSKAKVSTILTNLDRKGLIVRERSGKTYKVYLSSFFAKGAE